VKETPPICWSFSAFLQCLLSPPFPLLFFFAAFTLSFPVLVIPTGTNSQIAPFSQFKTLFGDPIVKDFVVLCLRPLMLFFFSLFALIPPFRFCLSAPDMSLGISLQIIITLAFPRSLTDSTRHPLPLDVLPLDLFVNVLSSLCWKSIKI